MSKLKLLLRPTLYTIGFCGTCFTGAAIYQYENRMKHRNHYSNWLQNQQLLKFDKSTHIVGEKYSKFRQDINILFNQTASQFNQWFNSKSRGERLAFGTICLNLFVCLLWRKRSLLPVMEKYFLSHTNNTKLLISPMLLSCFSHISPVHLCFNMYALYSFSNIAQSLLGTEQLIALYLSAGFFSCLISVACRLLTSRSIPSLGASGAILGVVGYVCIAQPDTRLLLLVIPVAAGNAIKALMAFDAVGVLARWQMIDHAGHLGGSIFGIWYAKYGERLFYEHRRTITDRWIKIKNSFS